MIGSVQPAGPTGSRVLLALGVLSMACAMAGPARAATSDALVPIEEQLDELEKIEVLQNRKYQMKHELALRLGTLPLDPYVKGYTVGLSYSWHILDWLAWELLDVNYSFGVPTKLQEEVRRIAAGRPGEPPAFPDIRWMAASRAVFKPLYGKEAAFNTDVIHLEAYLAAGADALYVEQVPGRRGIARDRFAFGFDVGGGLRVHMHPNWSLRFDITEVVYFLPTGVAQALHLRVGISSNLWFED